LGEFLRVGRDLVFGRRRGFVVARHRGGTRKVFCEQGVSSFVLGCCNWFRN
jgi:hypothetical protein